MRQIPFFVMLGFPGSGKTTLGNAFQQKHPEYQQIFVFDFFLKNNLIDRQGIVQDPDYVQKGHRFLYQSLKNIDQPTILELGTSIPEFNCQELRKLKNNQPINLRVLFCFCPAKLALERHLKRHREVPYRMEHLENRYQRDFPGEYYRHCQKYDLPYQQFDMEKPIEENLANWEKLLN